MAFPPHHHPHHHQHGFMFHSHEEGDHLPSPNSSLSSHLHSCPPQLFPGGGGGPFMMKRSMSFSGIEKCENETMNNVGDDDLSDDGSQLGEKKKRLNLEQVKALEKSFEVGNKLEPERKMQLAKALGLQPRQIAIWFQNRRARWKTKQLERDYEVLKKQFDSMKADNDALQSQNKKLHAELTALKGRDYPNDQVINNLKKENNNNDQGSWSNGSENSCDVNLDISRKTPMATSPVVSSQMSIKHLFSTNSNSNTTTRPITSMTQLLQGGSTRSDLLHSLKVNDQIVHHHHHQEENLICNMFNGVDQDQQQGFWPWADQQPASFSLNQTQFSNN